ncbi:alpha-crystallin A chain-like [Daktulosphaira vitifoliae]|uniref:alpha-crystallin A chain-like n=1 Tax=Daktulosphaira vitifoliae TaxID=58002 RepID=UPI0021A9E772|nr:alpha-crystallin A chain-like [Daktulosphaira vitifoliae]
MFKMSLLPYIVEQLSRPTMYDQHFGMGIMDDDMMLPTMSMWPAYNSRVYHRPSAMWPTHRSSGLSHIQNDHKNFKVNLDVQQFKPEEVSVKVDNNGYIVVQGEHEERSDEHGFVSRQFTRRYKMPENVDPNTVMSQLSSDGVLSIMAPKKTSDKSGERPVPIVHTNQPSIKVTKEKDHSQHNGEKQSTKN